MGEGNFNEVDMAISITAATTTGEIDATFAWDISRRVRLFHKVKLNRKLLGAESATLSIMRFYHLYLQRVTTTWRALKPCAGFPRDISHRFDFPLQHSMIAVRDNVSVGYCAKLTCPSIRSYDVRIFLKLISRAPNGAIGTARHLGKSEVRAKGLSVWKYFL